MARPQGFSPPSQLETEFASDSETIHVYREVDPTTHQIIHRKEHWEQRWQIGRGASGDVWSEKCTKGGRGVQVRAVKRIWLGRESANIQRELEAIVRFSNPEYQRFFVQSFGWYQSRQHLCIAMEYFERGDLQRYICKNPRLKEFEVKEIISQLLQGLCCMHNIGIAHRDLKPGNILLQSCPPKEKQWLVKIADFGISKRFERKVETLTNIGTRFYMAPEVLGLTKEMGSAPAVDIWALGEIAFRLLLDGPTFENNDALCGYARGDLPFPHARLRRAIVSQPGIDFILCAMRPIPSERFSAMEALSHKWLQNSGSFHGISETTEPDRVHDTASSNSMTDPFVLPLTFERRDDTIGDRQYDHCSWTTPSAGTQRPTTRIGQPLSLQNQAGSADIPVLESSRQSFSREDLLASSISTDSSVSIWAVGISPDGTPVASASDDGILRSYDSLTRRVYPVPGCDIGITNTGASSLGGKSVLSTSQDGTVHLGGSNTGMEETILDGQWFLCSSQNTSIVFSSDARWLASALDETIRLWDRRTGKLHATLQGHAALVNTVTFSPDCKLLASVSRDRTVKLWNCDAGLVYTTFISSLPISAMAFSPNSECVASASGASMKLWSPENGEAYCTIGEGGHPFFISAVSFSSDGAMMASVSDGTARLWGRENGNMRCVLKGHARSNKGVTFSPNGKLVASAINGVVKLWSTTTGALHTTLGGLLFPVAAMAFASDEQLVAASSDGIIKLWDPDTRATRTMHKGPWFLRRNTTVAFSSAGKLVASTSDRVIILWNSDTGLVRTTLRGHLSPVRMLVCSPNGKLMASVSRETLILWDLDMGDELARVDNPPHSIHALDFSPDSKRLAYACGRAIKLWDVDAKKVLDTLKGSWQEFGAVTYVVFSPSGKRLAAVSEGTLKLWNIQKRTHSTLKRAHMESVEAAVFSPDGRQLASVLKDSILLWDTYTGKVQKAFRTSSTWVRDVAFSPGGSQIACASRDGTVQVWTA